MPRYVCTAQSGEHTTEFYVDANSEQDARMVAENTAAQELSKAGKPTDNPTVPTITEYVGE